MRTTTRQVSGLITSSTLFSGDNIMDRHMKRQLSQEIKDDGPMPFEVYFLSAPKLFPK
jgi:hypothetical protein